MPEHVLARKQIIENSIILARRYSKAPNYLTGKGDENTDSSQGYIQDHYSPRSSRKFLPKSKSVDCSHVEVITFDKVNHINNNYKSSPNVSKHRIANTGKSKLINCLLKNPIGQKALQTIAKVTKKSSTVNSNENDSLLNRSIIKNSTIKQDGDVTDTALSPSYRQIDKCPQAVHNTRSNELKYRDVSKQLIVTDTKELPKESENRSKLKYSPPPELIASTKTISADLALITSLTPTIKSTGNGNGVVCGMLCGGLKLKERLVVGFCVAAVLFTLLLVMDIQMDLGVSRKHLMLASHGRVKYVSHEDGPGSVYNRFRNRLLQKTNR